MSDGGESLPNRNVAAWNIGASRAFRMTVPSVVDTQEHQPVIKRKRRNDSPPPVILERQITAGRAYHQLLYELLTATVLEEG